MMNRHIRLSSLKFSTILQLALPKKRKTKSPTLSPLWTRRCTKQEPFHCQCRNPSKVFNTNNPANLPSTISPPPVRSNIPYYYQYNLQYSIIYTTK